MGSALYAFMQSAPSEVPVLVKRFENFNSLYIAIPIASYYIDHGDQSKYDWFVQKMDKMKSEGLWYMLQYFGEFLMKSPVLDQRKGIVVLEQYARHHKSMYVRMAAYQGLGLLVELSGVKEMREDIRKNEKDDNLKKVYRSMN
jgi:aminopeptidase N